LGLTRLLVVAIAATLFIPSSAVAQGRPGANPCVGPGPRVVPILRPVDEGSRRADFLEFRRRLQDAVARKDEAAVLASVDPTVRISFGDSGGAPAFKAQVIGDRNEDFWGEFGTILRLGGRFRTNETFDAPYTFSAWPENLDSFECLAITGSRVRVRAAAGLDARIVTQVDFAIVRANPPKKADTPGWRGIELPDGRTGFVSSRYVRSPIDHRALFQFHDGRWWLMAYVAGD
jgi:hypothetical protein